MPCENEVTARTQWSARKRGYCANAVERAHTKSIDANDKLIQTRPHVWNTIASRKQQFVMQKGKSTILAQCKSYNLSTELKNLYLQQRSKTNAGFVVTDHSSAVLPDAG